ncbi:MAG: hydantoinase B/oxoprolinase family protein [Actinomycetota bacterium]
MDNTGIVVLQVIQNRLKAIAELMGQVLVRSAFSANIKERRDCSTAIFDKRGQLIAQAEHIPLHLGSMLGVVREVLKEYGKDIRQGDVFIANDPYKGGTHLPDITLVSPFFYKGKLRGFAANIAHHSDIGGAMPGGISGNARSIYEEGLRIPPVKLIYQGRPDKELLRLIYINCRVPGERQADLDAQVATNKMGIKHLNELWEKYGSTKISKAISECMDYTEGRLRDKIRNLKDGTYKFADKLDDDGITDKPIDIRVLINIEGDRIVFDFTGTGRESKGAINVVRSALIATIFYVLKAFFDPELPANSGIERAIDIKVPDSSIINPSPGAAVGARTDTCQRIAGTIIGALNKADPQKAVAGSNDASTAVVFSDGQTFVYVEAVAGGAGAYEGGDGMDAVQVHITNTSNLPIEALEKEFPIMVEKYELIPDSGGKGKFRGGLGLVRRIKVLEDGIIFSSHGDRHKFPPWGWNGGMNGKTGRFLLNDKTVIPSKSSNILLGKGDTIDVETPGGGGFGDYSERGEALINKDLKEGKMVGEYEQRKS